MGILSAILFAPLRAPAQSAIWVARKLAEQAEAERNSPTVLRAALAEAERQLLSGEMDEDTYDEIETDLLLRIRELPGQ